MKHQLIILSAPSGTGKTTLCNRLLADLKGKLVLSISSTTRKIRPNETPNKDYFFISEDEFKKNIDQNCFAEWAIVHDHYYGTSKKFIDTTLNQKKSILLEIDVQGASSLRNAYPTQNVSIFIAPPSFAELENRLRNRKTDSEETIQRRLRNAKKEMEHVDEFDKKIINENLETAYKELLCYVCQRLEIPAPNQGEYKG